jgi:5-deoxy-glucuronate isomerase
MTSSLFLPAGSTATDGDLLNITPASAGWTYCGLRVLRIAAGEQRRIDTGTAEMAVLPLSGGCTVAVEGHEFLLHGRDGVFGGISDFAYVPIGVEVQITATRPAEIALCSSEASRRVEPYRVAAEDVAVEVRGGGQASRQINNFLSADNNDAHKLIAVEVLTPEGAWSSWPPHKHDETSEAEVDLEEIYYFRIDGAGGTGYFACYTPDGEIDDTVTVRDGDVYLVPRGFHGPSAAAPGYHMYFLNVMGGPQDHRAWRYSDDPAHGWQRARLEGMDPDPRLPLTTATGPTT